MTTSTLRLPPRIARLPQLRQIVRGGLAARGSIGAGLAAKTGGAAAGNGLLNNLVAYWPLNEAAGANNALDLHTNALTLTQTASPGSAAGKVYSGARTFDGNSHYFKRTSETLLNPGNTDVTLAAWVKLDRTDVTQSIVAKWYTSSQYSFLLYYHAITRWVFSVSRDGSQTASAFSAPGAAQVGIWYLVVGWHDSVADKLYLQANNGTVANATYDA